MTTERFDIVVTEQGTRVVRTGIEGIGVASEQSALLVDTLKEALKFVGVAVGLEALKDMADAGTKVNNILKLATGSQKEFAEASKFVFDTAKQTATPVEALAELYDSINTAGKDFNATQKDTQNVVSVVAEAFAAEGKSAADADGALRALSRSLVKGKADTRGILAVLNESNFLAETLAKQFHLSVGEFVAAVAAGKVSSEDFFNALKRSKTEVDAAFAQSSRTFSQAITILQTSVVEALANIQNATGVFTGLANVIAFVGQHITLILPILAAFAAQWGIGLVASLFAAGSGLSAVVGWMRIVFSLTSATNVIMVIFNATIRANPLGLLLTLLAATGTALAAMGVSIKNVVAVLKAFWDLIKNVGEAILTLNLDIDKLRTSVNNFLDSLTHLFDKTDDVETAVSDLGSGASGTAPQVDELTKSTLDGAVALEAFKQPGDEVAKITLPALGDGALSAASDLAALTQAFETAASSAGNFSAAAGGTFNTVMLGNGSRSSSGSGGGSGYVAGSVSSDPRTVQARDNLSDFYAGLGMFNKAEQVHSILISALTDTTAQRIRFEQELFRLQNLQSNATGKLDALRGGAGTSPTSSIPSVASPTVTSPAKAPVVYVSINTPNLASFQGTQDQVRRQMALAIQAAMRGA
jgi:tape measure domain-containing protein